MKVSIVTPSYNQAPFLAETIESVLDQDYPEIEYVVVDGSSSDESVAVARSYEQRLSRLVVQQANVGQPAAINEGFGATDGELMAYVNSDDTLLPGAVSEMVAEFAADSELVLVYGDALYTDAGSNRTGYLTSREWDPPEMVRRCDNHVVQPSSMWTRAAWERAGPFDERGYYFFDFEFYLRLSVLGRVRRVPRPWSTYREHAESKTMSNHAAKAHDYLRFADEFLTSERLPPELRPSVPAGRSRARIAAARELYGWRLEPWLVRRCLWKAFVLQPRNADRSFFWLALKSLLPVALVRRLREVAHVAGRG